MKADAQEGLGTVRVPQLTTFELPTFIVYSLIILLMLAHFTCYPPLSTSIQIPFTSNEIPANIVDAFFSPAWAFTTMPGFRPTIHK
ncbi:hypothetical protein J3A83DRAFT_1013086 [Scleroderma citrinum]